MATVLAGTSAFLGGACGRLLDADSYRVVERADAGDAGSIAIAVPGDAGTALDAADACVDPAGFAGKGCFACEPSTRDERLNACTTGECHPFDNDARLRDALGGGALPELPPFDGGAPTGDAGTGGSPDAGSTNPRCATLPDPVYVVGSSAAKPFLARVGQAIGATRTIVYSSQGSCVGVDAALNGTATTGAATWWEPGASDVAPLERKCDLEPPGIAADIGISDAFPTTCADLPQGLPSNVADFFGPVQVMAFVVPAASTQTSISAEAAYLVFGFGGAEHAVAPWTDGALVFQRNGSSGTQNLIGAEIGVPAPRWRGKTNKASDDMRKSLAAVAPADADRAIGILSSDYADDIRGEDRVLAYQARGQKCGFWPDSTPTARDKRNVRDGHYPMWGPLHLLAHVGAQGVPAKDGIAAVVGHLTGTRPLPNGVSLIDLYAERHLVPLCAMSVTRASDGGPLAPYRADRPCGCYFDARATGHTDCAPCTTSAECPSDAPACSYGYCER
jgi:hypothetical protein